MNERDSGFTRIVQRDTA